MLDAAQQIIFEVEIYGFPNWVEILNYWVCVTEIKYSWFDVVWIYKRTQKPADSNESENFDAVYKLN